MMKSKQIYYYKDELNDEFSGAEKRLSEFRKLRKIGEGTYGEVYEAMDTINNRRVAMKKMRIENKDEGIRITALREMCILKLLMRLSSLMEQSSVLNTKQQRRWTTRE